MYSWIVTPCSLALNSLVEMLNRRAPEGYEDETGFHFGPVPTIAPPSAPRRGPRELSASLRPARLSRAA
ncbi:MAG: hypothetical protein B9S34_03165 [Opitutia bacterium Tous-C1TDCM]|nr:MAG: hypothetical protein B9S34_03165 [Opitutae bacterium Tous-C1TDCM]